MTKAKLDLSNVDIKQIVFLTSRAASIKETLKFVDYFMPFIEKVLLCCPDNIENEMKTCYEGRLKIETLTDGEILNGEKLPDDHQKRNTFLRVLSFKNNIVDDVFIMSDDDYRPLIKVDSSFYLRNNRYQAYYFYELDNWIGADIRPTSYDEGMFRTRDYLKLKNLPTKQYSSHMPQIIDKRLYLEMVNMYEGIELEGLDEWSIYFNYLTKFYPDYINNNIYKTLNWPGHIEERRMNYYPEEFVFENYYEELYNPNCVLDGFSKVFHDGIENENKRKISYMRELYNKRIKADKDYDAFVKEYKEEYGDEPRFEIKIINNELSISTPKYIKVSPIYPQYFYLMSNFDNVSGNELIKLKYIISYKYLPMFLVKRKQWINSKMLTREKYRELMLIGKDPSNKKKNYNLYIVAESDFAKSAFAKTRVIYEE